MPDLREQWPSLSPRERDAKVAEALGYKVLWFGLTPEHRVPAVVEASAAWPVPLYCTWEHAGPLLDRLREEGWDYKLICAPQGLALTATRVTEEDLRRVDSGWHTIAPEAIALAFCLSREASRG